MTAPVSAVAFAFTDFPDVHYFAQIIQHFLSFVRACDTCSASSPSGNLVGGLPLVVNA